MNKEKFSRSIGLLGEDYFVRNNDKLILVAGLGGVGGTTFEALVRTGYKNFVIVDRDVVAISNLNRQLLYTENDLGKAKVEVATSRAKSINPEVEIKAYQKDIKEVLPVNVDFIVDCIDDVSAKVTLIKYAKENNIPIISSMGMANKLDPTQIKIATINKSTVDPLAKKMRYELKQAGVDYKDIPCVYSTELPTREGATLNSIMSVTSTAGLYIANFVINYYK